MCSEMNRLVGRCALCPAAHRSSRRTNLLHPPAPCAQTCCQPARPPRPPPPHPHTLERTRGPSPLPPAPHPLPCLCPSLQRLGLPAERVVSNLAHYGNTSAASIPLALDEAVRGGSIKKGDKVGGGAAAPQGRRGGGGGGGSSQNIQQLVCRYLNRRKSPESSIYAKLRSARGPTSRGIAVSLAVQVAPAITCERM